jgi:hypothetical protein
MQIGEQGFVNSSRDGAVVDSAKWFKIEIAPQVDNAFVFMILSVVPFMVKIVDESPGGQSKSPSIIGESI